jgi:hypothetical protein
MSESDRKRVAYHEAGHAVANRRFGILQAKATILSRDAYAGAVVWEGKEHVWSANEAPAQVLSYCAGYAALVSIGVERDIALQGCSNDMEAAAELIARWPLSGTLDEWQSKAVELMSRPENIRAVDFVANALLRHETLNDVYLDMLVEFADALAGQTRSRHRIADALEIPAVTLDVNRENRASAKQPEQKAT